MTALHELSPEGIFLLLLALSLLVLLFVLSVDDWWRGRARGRRALTVIEEIAAERQRQVSKEGWSPNHDDQHDDASLAMAAALYAAPEPLYRIVQRSNGVVWVDPWPWQRTETYHRYGDGDPTYKVPDGDKRKTHDNRRRLVISAALIIAEIERLDRKTSAAPSVALTVQDRPTSHSDTGEQS